jgi:hypothetical protein
MRNDTLLTPPASYGAVNSDEENDSSYEIPPSFAISLEQRFDDDDHPDSLSQKLLTRAQSFCLPHDTERGFCGTQLKLSSFPCPHMRAFHGSWICYFLSLCLQFALCPLLPEIAMSLHLTKSNVWLTNIYSMAGGIPMGLVLGLVCDQYGARILITLMSHVGGRGHSLFVYRSRHQSTWVSVQIVVVMICWICTKVYSYVLHYYGFDS